MLCHTCKHEYEPSKFKQKKNGAYTVTCLCCLEKARRYRSNKKINITPEPVIQQHINITPEPVIQTPKLTYYDIIGDDNIKNIILDYARGDNNHWRNVFKDSINEINNISSNAYKNKFILLKFENEDYYYICFTRFKNNQWMVTLNYKFRINKSKNKKK